MSYSKIYVTRQDATSFRFTDGFGANTKDIVADNVVCAVMLFKQEVPQTQESPFVDYYTFVPIVVPQLGDKCCAACEVPDVFKHGVITNFDVDNGLAHSDLDFMFCGDIPTQQKDGVWIFTSF